MSSEEKPFPELNREGGGIDASLLARIVSWFALPEPPVYLRSDREVADKLRAEWIRNYLPGE